MERLFRNVTLSALIGLVLVFGVNVRAKEIIIPSEPTQNTEDSSINKNETNSTAEDNSTTENKSITEGENQNSDSSNGWDSNKTVYYKNGKAVKGWNKIDGKLYYFTKKKRLYTKTGLRKINGKKFYFSKAHYVETGVVKVKNKYYYFRKKDGSRYEKSGINKIDGKYYMLSDNYSLISGWQRNGKNKRYYFDKKTFDAKVGWNYVGKYKYFFNSKGQLQQDIRKKLTKEQKKSYLIRVNRKASCVTVYTKDGDKGYTIPVVAFVCSAGKGTPTGEFEILDKLRWHELMGPSWGQWCMHLTTDILFHSVFYNSERDNKSLSVSAYNKLGTMASHGCIRLRAGDSKWIYDNCKVGTKVVIYNNKKNPGPFDKPKAEKLSASHTWDPTDPTIK